MIVTSMANCTPSRSESEATDVEVISRAITKLSCFIDNLKQKCKQKLQLAAYLIEGWENVISKLNFSDWCMSN